MKIEINIPDSAVADVEEYCRVELHDTFQDRIQRLVDTFVSNTLYHMEQRREIASKIDQLQETIKENIYAK